MFSVYDTYIRIIITYRLFPQSHMHPGSSFTNGRKFCRRRRSKRSNLRVCRYFFTQSRNYPRKTQNAKLTLHVGLRLRLLYVSSYDY